MNFLDQLDPELRVVVEKLPTDRPLDLNDIPTARAKMKKMVTSLLAALPPVEDCYAGLKWLFAHADELGVDPSRIAIGGASGGGGLAAGLALLARDRAEVRVAFQLLIYPMIDDRNVTPASYAITDPRMWHRESNRLGWKAYLGREGGGADVSPYAAAARATDLTNLPPAYIPVGALDLFVDENIEYAQRLVQAGVPTELHVYPGAFHGFDLFAPSARVSKQFKGDRDDALKRALHNAAR